MRSKSLLNILFLLGMTLTLVQCGNEDSDTAQVSFSAIPGTPIVIESDFTYTTPANDPAGTPVSHKITGPWFQFSYSIDNQSALALTLITIKFTVTGGDSQTTFTSTLDAGTLLVNLDSDKTNDQTYLVSIAKQTKATPTVVWYIGGLPKSTTPTYSVQAEAIGWFGTPDAPLKSFKKKISFVTSTGN